VTLGSAFMPAGLEPGTAALLVSFVGLVVGFPCVSVWALFGVAIGRFLRDPAHLRAFNLAMAATLIVLAFTLLRH